MHPIDIHTVYQNVVHGIMPSMLIPTILEEVMEELLEENGYDIDDFENLLDEDDDNDE